jgi:hypothetical protein
VLERIPVGLLAQVAQSRANDPTNDLLGPLYLISYLVVLGIMIFCAYLTARNGRWGLFIAGFLCGFLWIVGALIGRPRGGGGGGGGYRSYRGRYRG